MEQQEARILAPARDGDVLACRRDPFDLRLDLSPVTYPERVVALEAQLR